MRTIQIYVVVTPSKVGLLKFQPVLIRKMTMQVSFFDPYLHFLGGNLQRWQ